MAFDHDNPVSDAL